MSFVKWIINAFFTALPFKFGWYAKIQPYLQTALVAAEKAIPNTTTNRPLAIFDMAANLIIEARGLDKDNTDHAAEIAKIQAVVSDELSKIQAAVVAKVESK